MMCGAVRYWYSPSGVAMSERCGHKAVMITRALDGSRTPFCADCGLKTIEAGAEKVEDL